ncbi:hypothetical protein AAGW05_02545 [Arthrobacter sp. LAPM80]|uniref:hypothetical protein n=1 Tax=Arthrobacter sp. LAPM80 TaxID=3141788 RepID=UPI00398A8729
MSVLGDGVGQVGGGFLALAVAVHGGAGVRTAAAFEPVPVHKSLARGVIGSHMPLSGQSHPVAVIGQHVGEDLLPGQGVRRPVTDLHPRQVVVDAVPGQDLPRHEAGTGGGADGETQKKFSRRVPLAVRESSTGVWMSSLPAQTGAHGP